MTTIYKYPLAITDRQQIKLPAGSIILTAQFQYGTLCIWVQVDTEQPIVLRSIIIYGTGHPHNNVGRYIGTAQDYNGSIVWHIFELL